MNAFSGMNKTKGSFLARTRKKQIGRSGPLAKIVGGEKLLEWPTSLCRTAITCLLKRVRTLARRYERGAEGEIGTRKREGSVPFFGH